MEKPRLLTAFSCTVQREGFLPPVLTFGWAEKIKPPTVHKVCSVPQLKNGHIWACPKYKGI